MNGHLERVRTASKVAVQLVWDVRPDLPDSTRTARQLLLKDPGRVTETDREALHAFFRTRALATLYDTVPPQSAAGRAGARQGSQGTDRAAAPPVVRGRVRRRSC